MQSVADQLKIKGKYTATCRGPRTEEEGKSIIAYLDTHPWIREKHGDLCNIVAAEIIGIELIDKWVDEIENIVVTAGKNHMLDNDLQTSVAIVGPFMGLISLASYSAIAAADTMGSHGGWLEAGNANAPTYTSPRKTCAWSAASAGAKVLSSALSFAITGTGTVKGAFIVYGTGAVSTIDNTSGTLFSAGLFGTGDRAVLSGDTLNISYTVSL